MTQRKIFFLNGRLYFQTALIHFFVVVVVFKLLRLNISLVAQETERELLPH